MAEAGQVKSAARVIEIFELFEAERRPLKISEIVAKLMLPQSSVSTLMRTLAARGYVEIDEETRAYQPSARLAFLGHWALGAPDAVEQVQTLMRQLADRTQESVLLGGRNGLFMQYLAIIESPLNLRFSLRPGLTRPLHACGIGIMLLTKEPDDVIRRIVRRYRAEYGGETNSVSEDAALAMVQEARDKGYCETHGIQTPGAGVIATLLPLPIRGRYLGVALSGPIARLDSHREELRETLKNLAWSFKGVE